MWASKYNLKTTINQGTFKMLMINTINTKLHKKKINKYNNTTYYVPIHSCSGNNDIKATI